MTSGLFWILDDSGRVPVATRDVDEWSRWFTHHDRRVATTEPILGIIVSTVFTGLSTSGLFESMVISTRADTELVDNMMRRYATWDEAHEGHWKMVEEVLAQMTGISSE